MNRFILIGLGNPGPEYEFTRHNAGKLFARFLKDHPIETVEAVETECFMNESGNWLESQLPKMAKRLNGLNGFQPFSHSDRFNHLCISHDDLDIPFGSFKIQFGKGPRQHKGILSIERALGTTEFWRVRIGVDNRATSNKRQVTGQNGEEYVLQSFSRAERKELPRVFESVRDQLELRIRALKRADRLSD